MTKKSELPGFYRLCMSERRVRAAEAAGLSPHDLASVASGAGLADEHAENMVENAIGVMGLPLGLCVNLLLDGRDHLVPMAVEEPSVVAACSYASKLLRAGGGVVSEVSPPHMIGQVQVLDVKHFDAAAEAVVGAKIELLGMANTGHAGLAAAGGGALDLEVARLDPHGEGDPCGTMLVVHLIVDVRDAMGANAINTMCERIAPRIAELTGGRVGLRILSNLSDRRTVTVIGKIPLAELEGKGCESGLALARGIEEASVFAERDPYRAATHNKGIMNGVDAALIALGQDWRAVEAGAHAFAARSGRYTALATWRVEGEFLVGRMTLPMAVGTVGGVVAVHPTVKALRKLAGIQSTAELASLVAAAGLAQNVSALRALAAEGIQSGHMRMHARNFAIEAGAVGDEVQAVVQRIAEQKQVSLATAKAALVEMRTIASAPPPATDAQPEARPEDRAFCQRILPGVSRTFALSIQALPAELREAVCVAYLLCRVVDTVEDDRRLAPSARGQLFDSFDASMKGSKTARFEALAKQLDLGTSETDRELVRNAGSVFRCFFSLPHEQREAIAPRVLEMSKGMRHYSVRADAERGLRLRDVEDLEKYCYYVAGTVGELLTDLFALVAPVDPARRKELEARAVAFGLGLQFVNILKDVAEDAERGDCFLPVLSARAHEFDLERVLDRRQRARGVALLRALSQRARVHLERAEEYTLLWPPTDGGLAVQRFCSVPLALALATLREVELGTDALIPGRAPTVSRELVMRVFGDAVAATEPGFGGSVAALRALFDRARAGGTTAPRRPTATPDYVAPAPISRVTVISEGAPVSDPKHVRRDISDLQPRREIGGKVLVTGAAGHVGANLVHRLLEEGRDVRVLLHGTSPHGAPDASEQAIVDLERATKKKIERAHGDLRDREAVVKATRGCKAVFHVAARVSTLSGSPKDLRDIFETNVTGTANVLRAAGEVGVTRTVVTGSLSAVGLDLDDPKRPSDESMGFYPFAEQLPYGRTKSLVEHEVLKACVEGIDAVVATSCAVLGPWDYRPSRMGKVLLDFTHGKLNAYLPGGFDFVNAKDLANGHVLALERGRTGQRYILSTEFATVDQLMEIFEEVSGRPRPRLRLPPGVMAGVARVSSLFMSTFFPDVEQRFTPAAVRLLRMERKADTTKAKTELGYEPTSIRSAIHEAYAHFARRGLVPAGPSLTEGDAPAPRKLAAEDDNEGAAA